LRSKRCAEGGAPKSAPRLKVALRVNDHLKEERGVSLTLRVLWGAEQRVERGVERLAVCDPLIAQPKAARELRPRGGVRVLLGGGKEQLLKGCAAFDG
jgi:hypothetical protein